MLKSILTCCSSLLLFCTCYAQNTAATSPKEPLFNTMAEATKQFAKLIGKDAGSLSMDGFVVMNFFTEGEGRASFPIQKVDIYAEEYPEEPGCGGVCPARIFIDFECYLEAGDCIENPVSKRVNDFKIISIHDIPRGRRLVELLLAVARISEGVGFII